MIIYTIIMIKERGYLSLRKFSEAALQKIV